ncbi:Probable magnesium transporter NIPA6, partial [Prunus dulcis]
NQNNSTKHLKKNGDAGAFVSETPIVPRKKKGLIKAGTKGIRAGSGGYTYLYEPLWWVGMISSHICHSTTMTDCQGIMMMAQMAPVMSAIV